MNIGQKIILGDYTSEHFETFQLPTPIPTNHPPSLSNPKPVQQQETAQDGWRKKDSKRKKKRARKDLKLIVQKTLNQGRPTLVNHSKGGDSNLWNPSQIADI
jgi:hypothetical protein